MPRLCLDCLKKSDAVDALYECCLDCLKKSDAVDALYECAKRLSKSGTDEGAPFIDLVKRMDSDYYGKP